MTLPLTNYLHRKGAFAELSSVACCLIFIAKGQPRERAFLNTKEPVCRYDGARKLLI